MTRREVGVIGGVGPAATAEFLARVVRWTQASRDQDHADLVVLQHSSIPDRTAHILDSSAPDPGPVLAADAARLESLGVVAIVIPCNTARAYISQVEAAVTIPVVDIVKAATDDVVARFPDAVKVGILATTGTIRSRTYHAELEAAGLEAIEPGSAHQDGLMELIYGQVKAGVAPDRALLDAAIADVTARGATACVLGCTELSFAAGQWDMGPRVLDALDSLARRAVTLAGCSTVAW